MTCRKHLVIEGVQKRIAKQRRQDSSHAKDNLREGADWTLGSSV